MKKYIFVLIVTVLYVSNLYSQIGGTATYKFLDLTNSARVASLGGNNVSIKDGDLNMVYYNPSLLDSTMDNNLTMNYIHYFADINWGYLSYAKHTKKIGTIATGMHYINYGKFIHADEYGNKLGEFTANEYAFNVFWAYPIDSLWTIGTNFKPILSMLETYTSFGLALDLGITYYKPQTGFSMALVLKNLGTQIKPYSTGNYEPLPLDLQFGVAKRLKHAPFRISILCQHLQKFDLTYDLPEQETNLGFTDTATVKSNAFLEYSEMGLRHFVFGVEFIPTKNFIVSLGYNQQRRQEMKLSTKSGLTGISAGVGIRIYKFYINYGISKYHLAGSSHHFSVSMNFNEFYKKN